MRIGREQAGPPTSESAACAITQDASPKVIGATSTRCMMGLLALLAGSPVLSQEVSLAELRQRCQNAREQRIAPLRKEIKDLLTLAEAQRAEAADYFQFTSLINASYTPEQKERLVETLWRVAYANEVLDKYEEHLVRKVADLLRVPHSAFIAAKHRSGGDA